MSEWWTYRPADFLMFAPQTYWRQFELHNALWWPLACVALAVGVLLTWASWRRRPGTSRMLALGLAMACAFVGQTFVFNRLGRIHTGAPAIAAAWFVVGALLLALGLRDGLVPVASARRRATGLGLLVVAWFAYPMLAPAFGRPLAQAEVLALAPDPTACSVLALAVLAAPRRRADRGLLGASAGLAALLLLASAATLGTMGEAQAWIVVAIVGVAGAVLTRPATAATKDTPASL